MFRVPGKTEAPRNNETKSRESRVVRTAWTNANFLSTVISHASALPKRGGKPGLRISTVTERSSLFNSTPDESLIGVGKPFAGKFTLIFFAFIEEDDSSTYNYN